LHDALCVVRSLVKSRYIISGGGAPEIELSLRLAEYARTLTGLSQASLSLQLFHLFSLNEKVYQSFTDFYSNRQGKLLRPGLR
jgi:hypothetical protein